MQQDPADCQDRNHRKGTWIILALLIWVASPTFWTSWLDQPQITSPTAAPSDAVSMLYSAPYVIVEQLGHWVWPFGRDGPPRPLETARLFPANLLYGIILILLLRHTYRLRRVNPWLFRALVWACLWLAPVSGLLLFYPQNPLSESWMILPSLGLSWAVAAVILQTGRAGSRLFRSGKYPPRLFVYLTIHVLLISWILSLATESYRRLSRSAAERVANAAQGDPSHFPAVLEYALQLAEEGRNAEATTLILNVESAAPWYREIPLVKAEVLLMGGHTQAAAHHVRQVLAKDPGNHRGLRILRAIHRNDAHCVMP